MGTDECIQISVQKLIIRSKKFYYISDINCHTWAQNMHLTQLKKNCIHFSFFFFGFRIHSQFRQTQYDLSYYVAWYNYDIIVRQYVLD